MSAGLTKKAIQVKYKKISFKDLEFDQGDDVSTRYGVVGLSLWHQIAFSPSLPPSLSPSLALSLSFSKEVSLVM